MFGFGDTTSKHKNLEPSEKPKLQIVFYFHFTFCFLFVFYVFFISYISFFFGFHFSGNRGLFWWNLAASCSPRFSTDFDVYLSLLFSTLFPSSIRVSIFTWFGICSSQIEVADLCLMCLEWEFNLKLIHMHLNIVQENLVRYGLKLQIWKYWYICD